MNSDDNTIKQDIIKKNGTNINKQDIIKKNGTNINKQDIIKKNGTNINKQGVTKKNDTNINKQGVTKKVDGKKKNGEKERKRLIDIVQHMKDDTVNGSNLKRKFFEVFGTPIQDIRLTGGRSHHFDIEILVDDVWKKVEVKSSDTLKTINAHKKPWHMGVQFANIGGDKVAIGLAYAQHFFYNIIPDISRKCNLIIPSYDDWKKEAFRQGKNSRLEFVKYLRYCHGGSRYLSDIRKKSFMTFEITDDISTQTVSEIQRKVRELMNDKHFWLQTTGKLDTDDIECKWDAVDHDSFEFDTIEVHKTRTTKKGKIIQNPNLIVHFLKGDVKKFEGILRWGYGQCLNNIRLDLK